MREILVKILCMFIPVENWRKRIGLFFLQTKDLDYYLNTDLPIRSDTSLIMYSTKCYLEKYGEKVDTIILGSSHAEYGVNVKYLKDFKAINLGFFGVDIYQTYCLYKKIVDLCPNLKNVLISYSTFSGTQINSFEKSKMFAVRMTIAALNYFWQIIPFYKNDEEKIKEYKVFFDRLYSDLKFDDAHKKAVENYRECINPEQSEKDIKTEASRYLKAVDKPQDAALKECIKKIVELSKTSNHALFFFTTPCHRFFVREFPEKEKTFKGLYKENYINVLEYFDDKRFEDRDFKDSHHLNRLGAKKLSILLNKELLNEK